MLHFLHQNGFKKFRMLRCQSIYGTNIKIIYHITLQKWCILCSQFPHVESQYIVKLGLHDDLQIT